MPLNSLLLNYLIYIYSLSLYVISNSSNPIIETVYRYYFDNRELYLYSSKQSHHFKVNVNLLSNYTWLYALPSYNTSNDIMTKEDSNLMVYLSKKESLLCIKRNDSFYFDTNSSINATFDLFFLQSTESLPPLKTRSFGSLGMSLYFANTSYSLIHQLKSKGIISHLSFSIVDRSHFFFGGIPSSATINKAHSYCDVIDSKSHWTCTIDSIEIEIKQKGEKETKRYEAKQNVTFTTENYKNYVPKSFFKFLIDEIYKDEIESNYFKIFKLSTGRLLYFYNSGFDTYENITIAIQGFEYTSCIWDYWYCDEGLCQLNLIENVFGEYWMFGHNFFRDYNTMFDYEKQRIHFYSSDGVIPSLVANSVIQSKGKVAIIQYALVFNSTLMLMGLILLVYSRYHHFKY